MTPTVPRCRRSINKTDSAVTHAHIPSIVVEVPGALTSSTERARPPGLAGGHNDQAASRGATGRRQRAKLLVGSRTRSTSACNFHRAGHRPSRISLTLASLGEEVEGTCGVIDRCCEIPGRSAKALGDWRPLSVCRLLGIPNFADSPSAQLKPASCYGGDAIRQTALPAYCLAGTHRAAQNNRRFDNWIARRLWPNR